MSGRDVLCSNLAEFINVSTAMPLNKQRYLYKVGTTTHVEQHVNKCD